MIIDALPKFIMVKFYGGSGHLFRSARTSYTHIKDLPELEPNQPEALSALILSFASIEAFLNELGQMVHSDPSGTHWRSSKLNSYGAQWDQIEADKESTLIKFEVACKTLHSKLDKGDLLYQNFHNLYLVRNALMHLQPDEGEILAGCNGTAFFENIPPPE